MEQVIPHEEGQTTTGSNSLLTRITQLLPTAQDVALFDSILSKKQVFTVHTEQHAAFYHFFTQYCKKNNVPAIPNPGYYHGIVHIYKLINEFNENKSQPSKPKNSKASTPQKQIMSDDGPSSKVQSHAIDNMEHFMAMLHLLFGEWANVIKTWDEIPPTLQQLTLTFPGIFQHILTRVQYPLQDRFFHRFLSPYIDLEAAQKLQTQLKWKASGATNISISDDRHNDLDYKSPNEVDFGSPFVYFNKLTEEKRIFWAMMLFYATKYTVMWHPEAKVWRVNDLVSIAYYIWRHNRFPERHHAALGPFINSIQSVVNNLRSLYYFNSCEEIFIVQLKPILEISVPLWQYHRQYAYSTSMKQWDNNYRTATMFKFQTCSPQKVNRMLCEQFKGHEYDEEKWETLDCASENNYVALMFQKDSFSYLDLHHTLEEKFAKPADWCNYQWKTFDIDGQCVAIVPCSSFFERLSIQFIAQQLCLINNHMDPARVATEQINYLPLTPHVVQAFFSQNDQLVFEAVKCLYAWTTWTLPIQENDPEWEKSFLKPDAVWSFPLYYRLPTLLEKMFPQVVRDSAEGCNEFELIYNEGFGKAEDCFRNRRRNDAITCPNPHKLLFRTLRIFLGINNQFQINCQNANYLVQLFDETFSNWSDIKAIQFISLDQQEIWESLVWFVGTALQYFEQRGDVENIHWPDHIKNETLPKRVPFLVALLWIATDSRVSSHFTKSVIVSIDLKSKCLNLSNSIYIPHGLHKKWTKEYCAPVKPLLRPAMQNGPSLDRYRKAIQFINNRESTMRDLENAVLNQRSKESVNRRDNYAKFVYNLLKPTVEADVAKSCCEPQLYTWRENKQHPVPYRHIQLLTDLSVVLEHGMNYLYRKTLNSEEKQNGIWKTKDGPTWSINLSGFNATDHSRSGNVDFVPHPGLFYYPMGYVNQINLYWYEWLPIYPHPTTMNNGDTPFRTGVEDLLICLNQAQSYFPVPAAFDSKWTKQNIKNSQVISPPTEAQCMYESINFSNNLSQ